MADEPDNEATETDETAVEAPEAEAEVSIEAEAGEGDSTEAAAAELDAGDGDTGDADASGAEPAQAAATTTEAHEQLPPKERRRKARSTHAGEARPSRTPEERHSERVAERKRKAVRRRARRLQERAKAAERRANAPAAEPLAPVHATVEGARRVRQGIVVSDKAEKTITVRIDVARPHRRYEKIVRSSSTLHAHDENNDAHEGDVVRVIESRPLSRTKRWKLVDVLERAR
jgi:small subunit ribosomal protein S17